MVIRWALLLILYCTARLVQVLGFEPLLVYVVVCLVGFKGEPCHASLLHSIFVITGQVAKVCHTFSSFSLTCVHSLFFVCFVFESVI